jgi:PAS domain S-box-containing protein
LNLSETDQIYRICQHGYVAECNEALGRLLSRQATEDLVGMPLVKLFPLADERVHEELRSFVRSGCTTATVETTAVDVEGVRSYRLRTHCGIVENNHLMRIWGITRDITEQRRAELAVEISDRRFRDVLESVRLPVLMVDTTGDITFCNEQMACLTGSSPTQLAGRNWLDIVPACERNRWDSLLSGRPALQSARHIDGVIRSDDGLSHSIGWDTVVIRDEDGEMIGLAAIGTSIQ